MSTEIHIHNPVDDRKLDRILALVTTHGIQLTTLVAQGKLIMTDLHDLDTAADATIAAITDESNKDDAIIALVKANVTQLTTIQAELAAALAANNPAAIQAVLDKVNAATTNALANSAKVLAAINAGIVTPTP